MSTFVTKRNGKKEKLNVDKINKCVQRACNGLADVSASEIVIDSNFQFFDGITTKELDKTLVLTARSKIYKEPNYSYVAGRLLLFSLYKEVFCENRDDDGFEIQYKLSFIRNIKKLVKVGILSPACLDYDLKKLAEALVPERDLIFKYHGIQNLYDRYFLRIDDVVAETPQAFYMRVAMGLCFNEANKEEMIVKLYNIYSQHLASPSTPTLFNSATVHNQLSSCYLSEIGDSVDGIFDGLWQEARKSKYAGGLGFHVSKIRGIGSHIKGTNGTSSGLIPWLKLYSTMLIACNQAGRRPGSGCAYLSNHHIEVEDFIDLRKETGEERRRTHDMNIALWVSDLFAERVEKDEDWLLLCPSEAPDLDDLYGDAFEKRYVEYEKMAADGDLKNFRVVKAKDLWKKMLKSYFETSHPWICWKDNFNNRYQNIHEGVLHGSNLCTEIGIHTESSKYKDGEKIELGKTGVCTLSSLNLSAFVEAGKINWDKLAETIPYVIRALDNAVELNFYPTKEAKRSAHDSRDLGMGTMGWADVYHKLNIIQDSGAGVALADKLMEFIAIKAGFASCDLAKERGSYANYAGSNWSKGILPIDTYEQLAKAKGVKHSMAHHPHRSDWNVLRHAAQDHGIRNAQLLAIAPNASIAYQLGVEQSIEPMFSVLFAYENKSGKYFIINEHFVNDMKQEGLWSLAFAEAVKSADGDVSLLDIPDKYKAKYKTAFQRDQLKLVEGVAARQKWIDQAISFNGYLGTPSLKALSEYYLLGNHLGVKSHYYLRVPAASKVQKSAVEEAQPGAACSLEAVKNGTCETCQG